MRILFWQWNAFMQRGMENALRKLNIEYHVFYSPLADWEQDEKFALRLSRELEKASYDAVVSVNFCPIISDICEKKGIRYLAWVYDSPIHIRDISTFYNDCNRIYFFDRGQAEKYRNDGFKNVYHLPLAADDAVWKLSKDKKYDCDIAFVGQLYRSDYNYLMSPLPQYYRGKMDGILAAQGQLYGAYLLEELITEKLMEELNVFYLKASEGTKAVTRAEMEYACACEITGRERFTALSLLANRYNVHLYSGDAGYTIEGIKSCGYADYYTEMPSVFSHAKINLNISLKTIRTGIPLRVLDVLSCRGFLLTNYQEELLEYFEPGADLVIYEDIKDLVLKADYYLKHEEERRKIAESGYRKVKALFGFEERIKHLLGD